MTDYQPIYVPAKVITLTASADISGGQALVITGQNTVGPCTTQGATNWVGIAAKDVKSGDRITFWGRGIVHESVADGTVTAGDQLQTSANPTRQVKTLGAAATATAADINLARAVIGIALNSAADGVKVRWLEFLEEGPMSDYAPVNSDSGPVTMTAGAVLTGGLLVCSSGVDDGVIHTTASTTGRRPLGVASKDAASGERIGVFPIPGYIHSVPVENGVTVNDGDLVVASTTPGRITSVPVWSTAGVTSGGVFLPTSLQAIGTVVRGTTGTTSSVAGVGVARFLGE